MKRKHYSTLIDRIQYHYDSLPESECAIADLLLEFPGDAVLFQSSELAVRAGTSNAAVSRLVKRLGYNDFREIQKEVRNSQILGIPLYRISSAAATLTKDGWATQHLKTDIECLNRTYMALDSEVFEEAVKATVKAKRIWTLGLRNGQFFAHHIRRQLIHFRPNVTPLPMLGQSVMEELASASSQDLVIAVSVRRHAPQLKTYFQILEKKGVPILYFCDHQTVSTAKLATWVFRCYITGVDRLDSYASVMSLLGTFCARYAMLAGHEAFEYNKIVEHWLDAAGEIESRN